MPLQKYEHIRDLYILQKFINRADRIEVKTNRWLEGEIENLGYKVRYAGDSIAKSRCQIDNNNQIVTVEEFSGEISYRNRFTLAMAIIGILIYRSDKVLSRQIGILGEKTIDDTLRFDEFITFYNIEADIKDLAGRVLVSQTFSRKIWEKARSLPIFASYFCISEESASIIVGTYGLRSK